MAKKKATKKNQPATEPAVLKPGRPIPPDPEDMNDARAEWAGLAVTAFAEEVFHNPNDREDDEMVLGDLLCDLRHWCDRKGLDFYKILAGSDCHYAEEIGCTNHREVVSPVAIAALSFYEYFQGYLNHDDYELPDCGKLRDELFKLGLSDDLNAAEVTDE